MHSRLLEVNTLKHWPTDGAFVTRRSPLVGAMESNLCLGWFDKTKGSLGSALSAMFDNALRRVRISNRRVVLLFSVVNRKFKYAHFKHFISADKRLKIPKCDMTYKIEDLKVVHNAVYSAVLTRISNGSNHHRTMRVRTTIEQFLAPIHYVYWQFNEFSEESFQNCFLASISLSRCNNQRSIGRCLRSIGG